MELTPSARTYPDHTSASVRRDSVETHSPGATVALGVPALASRHIRYGHSPILFFLHHVSKFLDKVEKQIDVLSDRAALSPSLYSILFPQTGKK